MEEKTKAFKVGDKVVIHSCGDYETNIESIEPQRNGNFVEDGYWSKNKDGVLKWSFAYEMSHVPPTIKP